MSRSKLYTGGRLSLNVPVTLVRSMERVRLKREDRTGLPTVAAAIYREALARGLALMESEEDALRTSRTTPLKPSLADVDAARRQVVHPALVEAEQEQPSIPAPVDQSSPWSIWKTRADLWVEEQFKPGTLSRQIAGNLVEAWHGRQEDVSPRRLPPVYWGDRSDRLPRAERIAHALRMAVPPPTPLFGLIEGQG